MKGLLVKDYYCLRRKLFIWAVTIAVTALVCVMFMVSTKTGNVALLYEKMANSEDSMDASLIPFLTRITLLLFLMMPVAASFDLVQYVLLDDKTASFYKVASSLPVSPYERVGERYLLLMIVTGGAFVIDAILLIPVKMTSDLMPFWDSLQIVLAVTGVAFFCVTVSLLFGYLFGADAAMWGNLAAVAVLILAAAVRNRGILKNILSNDSEESAFYMVQACTEAADFLEHKGHLVFLASLPVMGIGYLLTVLAAKRKRGVA